MIFSGVSERHRYMWQLVIDNSRMFLNNSGDVWAEVCTFWWLHVRAMKPSGQGADGFVEASGGIVIRPGGSEVG